MNFPASGSCAKYLYRNGRLSSSSEGLSIVLTSKNLGSRSFITFPSTLPLPAASQPSSTTSTGSFFSLTCICISASLFFASSTPSSISASTGLLGLFQLSSILSPFSGHHAAHTMILLKIPTHNYTCILSHCVSKQNTFYLCHNNIFTAIITARYANIMIYATASVRL